MRVRRTLYFRGQEKSNGAKLGNNGYSDSLSGQKVASPRMLCEKVNCLVARTPCAANGLIVFNVYGAIKIKILKADSLIECTF
jgi:hypothetical protein